MTVLSLMSMKELMTFMFIVSIMALMTSISVVSTTALMTDICHGVDICAVRDVHVRLHDLAI